MREKFSPAYTIPKNRQANLCVFDWRERRRYYCHQIAQARWVLGCQKADMKCEGQIGVFAVFLPFLNSISEH